MLFQFNIIYDKFVQLGLDFPVMSQLFAELVSNVTSTAFNRLMFRRDFCTYSSAIQIKYVFPFFGQRLIKACLFRHNVTLVQNWLRDHNLSTDALQPLMEACHLLQARKTEQDIDGFHDMCASLNVGQVRNYNLCMSY